MGFNKVDNVNTKVNCLHELSRRGQADEVVTNLDTLFRK